MINLDKIVHFLRILIYSQKNGNLGISMSCQEKALQQKQNTQVDQKELPGIIKMPEEISFQRKL